MARSTAQAVRSAAGSGAWFAVLLAALAAGALALPASVAAHGPTPPDPPTLAALALDWQVEPLVAATLLALAIGWLVLMWRVGRLHPEHPLPVGRTAAFFAGLATIAIALMSGIARYDTTLFSVHMVQHLLLMLVAAPLLAFSAPVTQVLRASPPGVRQGWLIPVLHSRIVEAIGHPVVGALTFTVVVWGSHFTGLFELALEDQGVHEIEHVAFLAAAMIFWWPVIAADPARRRMAFPVRALYLLVQVPVNSFLGMAFVFAPTPLYAHYANLGSPYRIDALADQQLAGGIMWLAGDVVFIAGILGIIAAWMRREQRDEPAAERRFEVERIALRERADRLARTKADRG
ncbi:MAG TPA: cytochrome c oxidase assembly protein [Candidatus Dormibacteraeota bacterium]|nr:cytochrome c oxidase assembly protein [Candidatus Dormibacteraeota bacterium]